MKTFRTVAAAGGLIVSLVAGGAAFGSTISKNLPAPVNQAFQGVGHVVNEAGRPVHQNAKDIGADLEGSKAKPHYYRSHRYVVATHRRYVHHRHHHRS